MRGRSAVQSEVLGLQDCRLRVPIHCFLAESHFADLAGTRTRIACGPAVRSHSLGSDRGLVEHLRADPLANFHRQGIVPRQLADKLYSILHRKDRRGAVLLLQRCESGDEVEFESLNKVRTTGGSVSAQASVLATHTKLRPVFAPLHAVWAHPESRSCSILYYFVVYKF